MTYYSTEAKFETIDSFLHARVSTLVEPQSLIEYEGPGKSNRKRLILSLYSGIANMNHILLPI